MEAHINWLKLIKRPDVRQGQVRSAGQARDVGWMKKTLVLPSRHGDELCSQERRLGLAQDLTPARGEQWLHDLTIMYQRMSTPKVERDLKIGL